jgi:hypothetical protein
MLSALNSRFIPNHVALFRPSDGGHSTIEELSGFIKSQVAVEGKATAYVCVNQTCKAPVTDVDDMLSLLESV